MVTMSVITLMTGVMVVSLATVLVFLITSDHINATCGGSISVTCHNDSQSYNLIASSIVNSIMATKPVSAIKSMPAVVVYSISVTGNNVSMHYDI